MSAHRNCHSCARTAVLWLLATVACPGELLYRTDFENFTAGDNKWHATDGWIASDIESGVQGIDQDVIPGGGLGKTAFIGYRQPPSLLTLVAKPVNYVPGTVGLPLVRVETLIGIQDSVVKPTRDSFFRQRVERCRRLPGGHPALTTARRLTASGVWMVPIRTTTPA